MRINRYCFLCYLFLLIKVITHAIDVALLKQWQFIDALLEEISCIRAMLGWKHGSRRFAMRSIHTKSIAESYEGKSAFVTGGTGFVGKVLIEKLLYRCPGIDKVFVLIREKKNVKPLQRLEKMLDEPMFSRLRNENPQAFDKIVPIAGDLTEPKLGIKDEDEKLLTDAVSYVFHIGATINFRAKLEVTMNYNFEGTDRVLDLCHRMKVIESLVHVSTAFSNTHRPVLEEVIYPPHASISKVREMLKNGITEEEVKKLIGKHPNTYTFSKALTETLVAERHGDIPTAIVRPAIVSAAKMDPLKGWVDNWNAATGITQILSSGRNRVMLCKESNIMDLIPVDYVANQLIVTAVRCNSAKDVAVYNCASSGENPITYGLWRKLALADTYKNKAYEVPLPFVYFTNYKWVVSVISFITETIPAYIADAVLTIRGEKPRYIKMYQIVSMTRDVQDFFTSNSWVVLTSKTKSLARSLSPSDQKIFPFDPTDIDWKEFITSYCKGIRKYLLKSEK